MALPSRFRTAEGHIPEPFQTGRVDIAEAVGNFLRTRDFQALPAFYSGDVLTGLEQRYMRAGIEPRHAASHDLDCQLTVVEVDLVDIGDLELATGGRFERRSDLEHPVVVKIKSCHRVARLGL